MSPASSCRHDCRPGLRLIACAGLLWILPFLAEARSAPSGQPQRADQVLTNLPEPICGPGFSAVQRWHLGAAFDAAFQSLERRPACRALFDGLEQDPFTALAGTLYEPARGALAKAYCRGAVAALTVVHGQRTRLCEAFQRLSKRDQAVLLIHEALHRAGMGENPPDPTAPTAREISARVRRACGL